jgi:Kef-type K+ transport system membrane component KefB
MSTTALLLQLIVILVTARACGWLLKYLGQPSVVGEMAAGLVLGPVCMGALFPDLHHQLFAPTLLAGLSALSTVGLVLFMFVVGLELRSHQGFRAQIKASGYVGGLSVIVPLVLGLAISPTIYPSLAPKGVGFWPFALFMSSALSITAFTVIALAAFVYLVLKPAFAWLLRTYAPDGEPTTAVMTSLMIGLLVCAMLTEWLHLHAVFGAFLFGTCLPRDDALLQSLGKRIEPISIVVLMPLFFALAGLGTTASAFNGAGFGAMALIVVVAVVGKIAGGAVGARMAGYGWRDSLATGSLMNARGLMELIVMKVGLDAGLIGPELFTMLLVMALVTTAMTGPLVTLFVGKPSTRASAAEPGTLAKS